MQITYFVQALFVAVALAAPAPQGGDNAPSGIFPSGNVPSGSAPSGVFPTGGSIPTGTGGIPVPTGGFPSHTGGGGHHHTRTRTGDDSAPTGPSTGGDEGDNGSNE
ncbi:hypothetical protein V502_10816 [Pseudogymnoascus sp. VKM F-4520 (FW-2644)]|nr:hypothetical protein V502_10816 [Pseudogymnoascus sp. VKM F-4520 (FW-2644)]